MVLGLRHFSNRTGGGSGGPFLDADDGEELLHIQPGVAVALANFPPVSPGTLYISNKQVIWLSDVERTKGYAVDFLSVSLHAVSRDPEAYPSPCIYTQIETEGCDDQSEGSDSESNHTLDLSRVTEMRLIPSDASQLDTLFDVFCQCAELNPEPIDEDVEEHDWVFNTDQMEDAEADGEDYISQNPTNLIGHSNGNHNLVHEVLQLQINDMRFEDADEVEHRKDGRPR